MSDACTFSLCRHLERAVLARSVAAVPPDPNIRGAVRIHQAAQHTGPLKERDTG